MINREDMLVGPERMTIYQSFWERIAEVAYFDEEGYVRMALLMRIFLCDCQSVKAHQKFKYTAKTVLI